MINLNYVLTFLLKTLLSDTEIVVTQKKKKKNSRKLLVTICGSG